MWRKQEKSPGRCTHKGWQCVDQPRANSGSERCRVFSRPFSSAQRFNLSLRFNAKVTFGHSALLVTKTSPPEVTTTKARGHQRDHPRFPVEPALYWQVVAERKIQGGFSSLFADLREQRRAAKAQKHSHPPPCFKMPHQIDV